MENLSQYDLDQLAIRNVCDREEISKVLIKSFNEYIEALPVVIREQFNQNISYDYKVPKDGIIRIEYGMSFRDIEIGTPLTSKMGQSCPLYPSEAKRAGKSYTAPINADIILWKTTYSDQNKSGNLQPNPTQEDIIKKQLLGHIPIMVKSNSCNLSKLSTEVMLELGEDPYELGGYFIVDGGSKVMISRKNNVKNIPTFKHHKTGVVECNFSSQMGDYYEQSKYLVMELLPNKELIIKISISRGLELIVPFYVIYHAFEMSSDKDIFSTIIPDYDEMQTNHIHTASLFSKSMSADYTALKDSISKVNRFQDYVDLKEEIKNDRELILTIAKILNANDKSLMIDRGYKLDNRDEQHTTYIQLKKMLDETILPHIGVDNNSRGDKLNAIGRLIRHMYDVSQGKSPTDRDSLENVAVYNPAPGLISMFKSVFNFATVTNIISSFKKVVIADPGFNMRDSFITSHNRGNLLTIINKTLTAGNNPEINIKRDSKIKNRNSTIKSDITNRGAEVSIAMSITNDPNTSDSKSSETVMKIRGVHASEEGVKCVIQSIEGADTGKVGQLSISGEITSAVESKPIIDLLKGEDLDTFDKMNKKGSTYSRVFVNGKELGTYKDTRLLAKKYRSYRRQGKIPYQTSILYKPLEGGELHFYTNMSRLIRPLIIVYQNREEYEDKYNTWPGKPEAADTSDTADKMTQADNKKGFQYILFTKRHAELLYHKQISIEDLVKEGVVEYIAPNENKNIIACDSLDTFMKRKDDRLYEYTHLSVPIGCLSASVLAGTFSGNTQPVRVVYLSKFVKQSFGETTNTYHNSYNKKLPVRLNNYSPVVKTVTDKLYNYGPFPVIAVILPDGNNQEDSMSISESFMQRNKTSVDIYNSTSVELTVTQQLETPGPKVKGVKRVDYSHLINGLPKRGTIIRKGMPLIGIVDTAKGEKVDSSKFFQKDDTVIVDNATSDYNETALVVRVSYKSFTPIDRGDKFAAKSGCKGVVSIIKPNHSMPRTASGIIPEIIINPSSFPTRFANGQIIEGTVGEKASMALCHTDGTFYKKPDMELFDKISDELGLDRNSEHILFNGNDGKRFRARIGVFVNGYHRLYKIIKENSGVVDLPSINSRTMQPDKGINKGGGQKAGYMEIDTYAAHGSAYLLNDLLAKDPDPKTLYICDNCNKLAPANEKASRFICISCRNATFTKFESTHATGQLFHYLNAFGIRAEIIREKTLI